jgi:hypothetical protein
MDCIKALLDEGIEGKRCLLSHLQGIEMAVVKAFPPA